MYTYLPNKYAKWYLKITSAAKTRKLSSDVYCEKHHIVPKSLGGSNSKDNLVNLTAREHFICHLLLTKMTEGRNKAKMVHALWMMTFVKNKDQTDRHKISSRQFEKLKLLKSQYSPRLGMHHSLESKLKISKSNIGKTQSAASKEQISKSIKEKYKSGEMVSWNKGISLTESHVKNISDSLKGTPRARFTDEHKANMALAAKNRKQGYCEICNRDMSFANLKRWHQH
jgi:hypothetical protein